MKMGLNRIGSGPIARRWRYCSLLRVKETQHLHDLLAKLRRVGTAAEMEEFHAEVRGLATSGAISDAAAVGILGARLSSPPLVRAGIAGSSDVPVLLLDELWKLLNTSTTLAELTALKAEVLAKSELDNEVQHQCAWLDFAIETKMLRLRRPTPPCDPEHRRQHAL